MATIIPTIFSDLYTVALFFSSLLLLKLRVLLRSTSAPAPTNPTRLGSIEAKYPAAPYSELKSAECAVCLSEFLRGESVRKLDCKHVFHRDCLDKWLTAGAAGTGSCCSCPLCRARLVIEEGGEREEAAAEEDCVGGEWGRREMFALLAKFREEDSWRRR